MLIIEADYPRLARNPDTFPGAYASIREEGRVRGETSIAGVRLESRAESVLRCTDPNMMENQLLARDESRSVCEDG